MFEREDSGGNESTRDKIGCSSEKAEVVFSSFCSRRDLPQSRSDVLLYSPLPSSRVYHDVRMAVLTDMGISNKASSPACDLPACDLPACYPFQRALPISPDPHIRPPVSISNQKQNDSTQWPSKPRPSGSNMTSIRTPPGADVRG